MSQNSNQDERFLTTLKNLKEIQNNQGLKLQKINSFADIKNNDKNRNQGMKSLHEVYMKIKVNKLVRLFIYKMKRSIKAPVPINYQIIQNNLEFTQKEKFVLPFFNIPDLIKAIFIVINILSIFILQIFSISQALLYDFRQIQQGKSIITMKVCILVVFLIKNILNFTFQNTFHQPIFRKFQNYQYRSSQFWIFIFDLLLFVMSILILVLWNQVGVGVAGFLIATMSFSGFIKRLQFIQVTYVDSFKKKQYMDLIRILLFNICSLQIFIAVIIAMSHYYPDNNWILKSIRNNNIRPDPHWWQIYIYSTYLTVATLQTVGFGDMIQSNYLEALTFIPLVFFGYFAFVYNVSEVASIISNLRNIDAERDEDTAVFKRMVKKQKITYELQESVLNYIQKSASIKSQYEFEERKKLLQKLPRQLRQEYQKQASKHIFAKIPFFKMLQSKTLIALSEQIQGKIYYPTQYLTQNQEKLTNIMILKHGKVGFAYCRQHSLLNGLILQSRTIDQENDNPYLLNQYLLVTDKQINYHIIASTYCFLYVITYDNFRNCLRINNKDNEFYFQMRSKLSYVDQEQDKQICQYCAPSRHSKFQCPRLHYMPYRVLIIEKNIFRKVYIQKRKPHFKRKYGPVKRNHTLQFWVKQFRKLKKQQKVQITRKINLSLNELDKQKQKNHSRKIETNEDAYNSLMQKLNQQFLTTRFDLIYEYNFDLDYVMDRMHNYANYFPDQNPSRLVWLSLNQQENNLIRKSNINQTRIFN